MFGDGIAGAYRMLVAMAAVGGCLTTPALAQDPYRVRGELETVASDSVTVRADTGESLTFALADDTGVFVVTPSTLGDIESGAFIGVTSIETEAQRIALEAHIFSEELRGIGEGHYAWDLINEPNMMTNATVAEVKTVGDNRELVLTYKEDPGESEGEQVIFVPEDIPIVAVAAADPSALEVGKAVFVMARDAIDGTPTAIATIVGAGGAEPPM